MEWLALSAFCCTLLLCIVFNYSILYALATGLLIFLIYGRKKGFGWSNLLRMAIDGALTVKNILVSFVLIGILTALWRAAGTIPVIVCYATEMITPSIFLLMTFLLNCGVSILTGTSFGTSATMGVICATIAIPMNIDIRLVGGATLAGAFFGDRCSPVSTSALLVAELTRTNVFDNIKNMVRSMIVPFVISCVIYYILGLSLQSHVEIIDLHILMGEAFNLHWLALIPATVILLLAIKRVNVKIAMTASILSALPFCIFLQNMNLGEILKVALMGFKSGDPVLSPMIDGGGLLSMLKTMGVVCLSSSYSTIFRETGILSGIKKGIETLAQKTTSFCAILCAAIITAGIGCNQTLAIILATQLCGCLHKNASQLALDLEDSVVVIAPLIPWSLACVVPLTSVNAPFSSIFFAFYLYLLPFWRLVLSFVHKKTEA